MKKTICIMLSMLFFSCNSDITIKTTPEDAKITVNNETYTTPVTLSLKNKTSYTLLFQAHGYNEKSVTLTTTNVDQEIHETLEAKEIKLNFIVSPERSTVKLNNKRVEGKSVMVKPGDFEIIVTHKDYTPVKKTLTLLPGNDHTETISLKKIPTYGDIVLEAAGNKDDIKLKELLTPYFQSKPVFDDLYGTPEEEKYHSIGELMSDLYSSNDWETLIYLLEMGASGFIELGDPLVESLLFKAIKADNVDLLKRLIDAGAKRDMESEFGNVTPDIFYAIKKKSYETLEYLLQTGSDPNKKVQFRSIGEYGGSKTYAVFNALKDPQAMEILIKYGASLTRERSIWYSDKKDGEYVKIFKTYTIVEKEGHYSESEAVTWEPM